VMSSSTPSLWPRTQSTVKFIIICK
jgi:hypothetical protein